MNLPLDPHASDPSQEIPEEETLKYIKIKLEIKDTGCGIKKENLNKLFMDFAKLDEHSKMNA
jgi:signal transduction histidine kinase